MKRREFIKGIVGSAVAARSFTARAQKSAMPMIRMLIIGYAFGIRSERALLREGKADMVRT